MKKSNLVLIAVTSLAFSAPTYADGGRSGTTQMTKQEISAVGEHQQTSDKVREAQVALNSYGYEVKVDGKMGPMTRSAIRKFQASRDLEKTGELDFATLTALDVFTYSEEEGRLPASVPEEEDTEIQYDERETLPIDDLPFNKKPSGVQY